ncbi:MAG: hypothetical protein KGL39_11930 [Patescibacteria group bacterium]|nr:hypothetical protein [Patescibacteria group bacterium]
MSAIRRRAIEQEEPDTWLVEIIHDLQGRVERLEGWVVKGFGAALLAVIGSAVNIWLQMHR